MGERGGKREIKWDASSATEWEERGMGSGEGSGGREREGEREGEVCDRSISICSFENFAMGEGGWEGKGEGGGGRRRGDITPCFFFVLAFALDISG